MGGGVVGPRPIVVDSFIEIYKNKYGGEGEIRTPDTGFPV
jgi:hypothetical protein